MEVPRQLKTWIKYNAPNITEPTLSARGEEDYGLSYPVGYEAPERTPDEAAAMLGETMESGEFRYPGGYEDFFKPTEEPAAVTPNRENFRNSAIKQLPGGKDPYLRDPNEEAKILFSQRIDGLRNHIFKGIPRGKELTAEQEAYFSKQAFQLYQMCAKETSSNIDTAKDALVDMMGRFEDAEQERKAKGTAAYQARTEVRAEERLGIARSEEARAAGKAPTRKRVWDKQLGQYVYRTNEEIAKTPNRFGEPTREAETTKGELTENQVRGSLQSVAKESIMTDIPLQFSNLWRKYIDYKKGGLSRSEAYAKVLDDIQIQVGAGDMPDPKLNKGKIIRDTVTGERRRSDGKNWIPVK